MATSASDEEYTAYSGEEKDEASTGDEEMDGLTGRGGSGGGVQEKFYCPVCCTMSTACHGCYIALFFFYIVLFPLWCKWLFTAPKPFAYWYEEWPDFPRVRPLHRSFIALGLNATPEIAMSPIPPEHSYCNYSCEEREGSQVSFDVALTLNADLTSHGAHTLFPVLFASNDFESWHLVADRRNAEPVPYWREDQGEGNHMYTLDTPACTRKVVANHSFTNEAGYIMACVVWSASKLAALQARLATPGPEGKVTGLTDMDLATLCDSAGGVCGYPCDSGIHSGRLDSCNDDSFINVSSLIPEGNFTGRVRIERCEESMGSKCITSTQPFSSWTCQTCNTRKVTEADLDFDLRRRLGDRRLQDSPPVEIEEQPYQSFPRMKVVYDHILTPSFVDVMSLPSVHLFAATSNPTRTWVTMYPDADPTNLRPLPEGVKGPTTFIVEDKVAMHRMKYIATDKVTIKPTACFGTRGRMYLVSCAINQSAYDDMTQWHNENHFKMGQKTIGPPFNDRCLAVSGRCGHACGPDSQLMPHCQADGYIDQKMLVGEVKILYNREPMIYGFILAMLCGFAVKSVMLCPGLYSPYRRCRFYAPDMTEQVRYIAAVGLFGDDDEGKGAMIRSIIGLVSCVPPNCQCRYHVVVCEEGHRNEMHVIWQKLCQVLEAVPNFGDTSYDENVAQLTHTWVSETTTLNLKQVGDKVEKLEAGVIDKLSGKSALKKLLKDSDWKEWDKTAYNELEQAMEELAKDLAVDYNVFTPLVHYMDVIQDWEPRDSMNSPLRMHFVARAKPYEDPRRTMKVQHVSEGTWYYTVPPSAHPHHWLQLRQMCREKPFSLADDDAEGFEVPLLSHHGKIGGLNFVDNYLSIVAERPENVYNDLRDEAPCFLAISEGRHQFQPDFMLSCLPCFFDSNYFLNKQVSFTQAPPCFPPEVEKDDYLDSNNAQFFRLYAMIRNCCGGVSPANTNTMWLLNKRESALIWEKRKAAVRDDTHRRRLCLFEHEEFNTHCRIEQEATNIERVFKGKYSHFVNRKLSFGMPKDHESFLGFQQRRIEGAVTLSLQWMSFHAAHTTRGNSYMMWMAFIGFIGYIIGLFRLATQTKTLSILSEVGIVSEQTMNLFMDPVTAFIRNNINTVDNIARDNDTPSSQVYIDMFAQFVLWMTTFLFFWFCLRTVTMTCKCFKRFCFFPSEMKWWGRLLIAADNITYFIWCWTPFFWLGFIIYSAIFRISIHFNPVGVTIFMLFLNIISWGLFISSSLRYSLMESMDANEIAKISLDNIWKANQLFFLSGPLQVFSLFTGFQSFTKHRVYGQDIGDSTDKDRTSAAVFIVKWWSLFIIVSAMFCWCCFIYKSHQFQNSLPACIMITIIALDMVPATVYLHIGGDYCSDAEVKQMRIQQMITSKRYYKRLFRKVFLSDFVCDSIKVVGPIWLLILPILTLWNSYFGVVGAFALVSLSPAH